MQSVRLLFIVCALVVLLVAPLVRASFILDNWQGPVDDVNVQPLTGVPATASFNGALHLVYRSSNSLYYTYSTNGQTFTGSSGLGTTSNTLYDPTLVVVTDTVTSTQQLVLLFVDTNNNVVSRIFSSTSNPFPGANAATTVSGANGELDSIFLTSTQQLVLVYPGSYAYNAGPNNNIPYYNGYVATATLSSGVLTWNNPLLIQTSPGNGVQWPGGAETAVFIVPGTETTSTPYVGIVQYCSGTGCVIYSNSPNTQYSWSTGSNLGAVTPSTSGTDGFSAVAFPIANGCTSLGAVFYVNTTGNGFGYSILVPQAGSIAPVPSVSRYVPITSPGVEQPAVALYNGNIVLLWVDISATIHDVKLIYTTPKL